MSDDELSPHAKAIAASQAFGLPLPRLQLTWVPGDEPGVAVCHYDLVFPVHRYDGRNIAGTGVATAVVGTTTSRNMGGVGVEGRGLGMPFRDGAHAHWDARLFGLRVFVVNGDRWRESRKADDDPPPRVTIEGVNGARADVPADDAPAF